MLRLALLQCSNVAFPIVLNMSMDPNEPRVDSSVAPVIGSPRALSDHGYALSPAADGFADDSDVIRQVDPLPPSLEPIDLSFPLNSGRNPTSPIPSVSASAPLRSPPTLSSQVSSRSGRDPSPPILSSQASSTSTLSAVRPSLNFHDPNWPDLYRQVERDRQRAYSARMTESEREERRARWRRLQAERDANRTPRELESRQEQLIRVHV